MEAVIRILLPCRFWAGVACCHLLLFFLPRREGKALELWVSRCVLGESLVCHVGGVWALLWAGADLEWALAALLGSALLGTWLGRIRGAVRDL